VFFADPKRPWQRGTNENTNGLLRQYFPKGTDLSRWSAEEIEAVAATINSRPRKVLGWKTPAEALDEHLRPLQQTGVASTAAGGRRLTNRVTSMRGSSVPTDVWRALCWWGA
jgi:hypothetical protein